MKKHNKFVYRFLGMMLMLIIIFSITSVSFGNTTNEIENSEFVEENRLQLLLVSFVFAFFGIGCCWMGENIGGLKFSLRLHGIKTIGKLSRLERVVYQDKRGYRCFMLYQIEDGEMIESDWPVLHQGLTLEKKVGKEFTIYYDPENPKKYDCSLFWSDKIFGIFVFLIGSLLIIGAIFILFMALFK